LLLLLAVWGCVLQGNAAQLKAAMLVEDVTNNEVRATKCNDIADLSVP
jgi:hypothetical protein